MKLYKETDFQETEIGKIPKEWKIVKLEELFNFQRGFSYRKEDINKSTSSIRFITINDLEKEGGWKSVSEPLYLSEEIKNSIESRFIANEEDLLIAITDMSKGFIIGAPLYVNVLRSKGEILVYSMDLVKLIPKKDINTKFYFYLFSWENIRKVMKSFAHGTNVLHLNLDLTSKLKIIMPPLYEQKRIADTLSTVDNAIKSIDSAVARLERLKKALMNELLTGRIRVREENGKLTFHTETEFQETQIGKIPKEWEVVKVNKLFDLYKGTTPSTKIKEYWNGTIPFVTPTDITKINDLNEMYLKTTENYITEKGLKSKGLKLVPKDSLLFTSRATIGYLAINKTEVAINQGIISLIPKDANIDVTFFYYFLQKLKSLFENLAGGSTYKEISMSTFSNVIVPLPSLPEQQRIADILSTVDRTIELYYKEKDVLKNLKMGLMDMLLTGKVRVRKD